MKTSMHYHAMGEPEDLGKKPGSKMRGPLNGCCRCEDHIAGPLKPTRARPACPMTCYLCERGAILAARFGG